jgi:hypothetical protein
MPVNTPRRIDEAVVRAWVERTRVSVRCRRKMTVTTLGRRASDITVSDRSSRHSGSDSRVGEREARQ